MKKTFRFKHLNQTQIAQVLKRCHTERLSTIGKDVGLDSRRVGELLKALGVERKRHSYGKFAKPYEALYNILIAEAVRGTRTVPVSLSYEEFLSFTNTKTCHYCNAGVLWAERIRHLGREGTNLDRKDNALGYSVDNCVVCCSSCNRAKGAQFTYEEFMMLSPTLKNIQELRKAML